METHSADLGDEKARQLLDRLAEAELFLRAQGIDLFRLHQHGDMVRIEVSESGIAVLKSSERRNAVVSRFKELGFLYVTLDLAVFHSGGVNQSL